MQGHRAQADLAVNSGSATDWLHDPGQITTFLSLSPHLKNRELSGNTVGALDEILPISSSVKPAIKGTKEISSKGYWLEFNLEFSQLIWP